MSVFIDPMIGELGVSRSAISTAYLVGTLSGALALPWIGRALDRFGVRPTLGAVALGFGAFLFLLAGTREVVGLTAGFVGARALGQGGMTMIATTAVGIAVTRRRGTALGITSAAGAAGIALFPLISERVISAIGWKYTFALEGALIWVIVLPIAWWGMRGVRPAAGGERSGEATGQTAAGNEPATVAWPLREIARTSMFWAITSAVACSGLVGTAVIFHLVAVLGEQGLTPTQAAANFVPQTIAGLLAALAFSAATDRFSPKLLIAGSMAVHAVTLLSLPLVSPGVSAMAFGAALGASASAARAVEAAAFPYYYGTASLGTLRGLTQSVTVASTAVAPLLLSLGYDISGSYVPPVMGMAALPAVIALAVPFARRPRRRSSEEGGDAGRQHPSVPSPPGAGAEGTELDPAKRPSDAGGGSRAADPREDAERATARRRGRRLRGPWSGRRHPRGARRGGAGGRGARKAPEGGPPGNGAGRAR